MNGKFIDNVSCSPAWLSLFHCGELSYELLYVCRCTCGNCKAMPTQRESICCQEIEQINSLLEDPCIVEARPSCITRHTDFSSVCLCRTVLTVSLFAHLHRYESAAEVPAGENR